MSDADDDNSYSSNEDYNEDDSNDDDHDDHDFPDEEYTANSTHIYDEENRQVMMRQYHSGPNNGVHDDSRTKKSNTVQNMSTKPVPALRNIPASYISLTKRTEDELELVSRKQASPRRHFRTRSNDERRNEIMAKRRSQNTVTLTFGDNRNFTGNTQSKIAGNNHTSHNSALNNELDFPLRNLAAGVADNPVSIQDARALETTAKKKLKLLKAELQVTQLDVAEAKLAEFAAKLQARQIKIHEKHAKLCKRRAVLKQAEEDQTALEMKLDEEEESHRDRERRVKNRDRRVKQEEAGLRIKEAALREREVAVSRSIERIERWRQIVDEKEEVQRQMEDILERKNEIQGNNPRNSGFRGKRNKRGDSKHKNETGGRKQDLIGHIISGMRRQHIHDHDNESQENDSRHHTRTKKFSSTDNESEVKSGAPSIWL